MYTWVGELSRTRREMPRLEAACCRNLFKAASAGPWNQGGASCPSACTSQGAWQHPAPTGTYMAVLTDHSPVHSRAAHRPSAFPGCSKTYTRSFSRYWGGHDALGTSRSLTRGSHPPPRCWTCQAGEQNTAILLWYLELRIQPLQTSHDTATANATFLQLDLPAVRSPQPGKGAEKVEGMCQPSGRASQHCSVPAASTADMGLADSCINDQQLP